MGRSIPNGQTKSIKWHEKKTEKKEKKSVAAEVSADLSIPRWLTSADHPVACMLHSLGLWNCAYYDKGLMLSLEARQQKAW